MANRRKQEGGDDDDLDGDEEKPKAGSKPGVCL